MWLQKLDCDGPCSRNTLICFEELCPRVRGGTSLQNSGQPITDLGAKNTSSHFALIFMIQETIMLACKSIWICPLTAVPLSNDIK